MDAPIYLASKEGSSLTPEQQWDNVRLVTELAEKIWSSVCRVTDVTRSCLGQLEYRYRFI
ncbi:hypothetical protein [Buttiauxella noackiae]|uniref:hypothetical protein n=1 Tax=Buttiauxella noackiae TaxID=82992 RepID=UPI0023535659|nr:hypothetical protein [Buttiauxella noackiae]MCA1923983.1 hypothetical protein [Buttiauxella noackiae]